MSEGRPPAGPGGPGWLNRTVVAFGLTSFLSDLGHEMATAVLPMHLSRMGFGAAALGVIEGIADAAGGLSKLGGGLAGQRLRRKKPWTAAGYAVTAAGTSALGWATTVPALAALRAVAWMGRGFRGPLRDYLVSDSVEPRFYGRAFGVERAGDMIGAVGGPLLALALMGAGLAFRGVLAIALVPGLAAALCVALLVRERPHEDADAPRPALRPPMPSGYWPLVAAVLVFGVGDFARSFLILAVATSIPFSPAAGRLAAYVLPVLLYAAHNAISAVATFPAGHGADRWGRRRTLAGGYALGLGVNLLLAVGMGSLPAVATAFLLSGMAIAIEETVEKAAVAEILPRESRSHGLGVLATANAAGDMISSVMVGVLWDRVGPGAAFGAAAACSAAGFFLLVAVSRGRAS